MGVDRRRSPGASIVTALVWAASAGCGSHLTAPSGLDASPRPPASGHPTGGRPPAADGAAMIRTDGGVPVGPGTAGATDAGVGSRTDGAPGTRLDGGGAVVSDPDAGGVVPHPDAGGAVVSHPDAGGTVVSRPDGGTAIGSQPDAGGLPLAPYPPATCPTTTPPRDVTYAPVQACGGRLSLASTPTLGSSALDHFYHCGAFGPELATDVRLSTDGSRLAVLTGAGTLRLFATDDWHEVVQIASPTGRIDAFAFSPVNGALATLSMEPGRISLWSTAEGKLVQTFTARGTSGGIPAWSSALAFSHDGQKLVSSLGGLIDVRTGNVVTLWNGPATTIQQLAFTMCDALVYVRNTAQTGDSNQSMEVTLYDATTGKPRTALFGNWTEYFGGSALSQDGRLVAVSNGYPPSNGGYDLSIYRGDTGELVDHRPGWTAGYIQAFTPDDSALMVTTSTNRLNQWRIADGQVVTSTYFPPGSRLLGFPRADAVAFSDPTETLTAGLTSGSSSLRGLPFAATAASWSGGGIGAAVAPDGALFHVWRDADGSSLCAPAPPTPAAPATSFALSPDGRVLAIGKTDGVIDLFDAQTGARRSSVETVQGPLRAIAVAADGRTVASRVDGNSPVLIWSDGLSAAVPAPAQTSPASYAPVSFALSPDGRTVALALGQSTVLVDVASSAVQTLSLLPYWAWPAGALFSPDSTHVAGRLSGVVSTWRVSDGWRDDQLPQPPAASAFTTGAMALTSDWSLAAVPNEADFAVWHLLGDASPLVVSGPPYQNSSILAIGTATVAVNQYLQHTFAADYYVAHLYDATTGIQLRQFDGYGGNRPLLLSPDGQRAYTLEGPDVIAWCR